MLATHRIWLLFGCLAVAAALLAAGVAAILFDSKGAVLKEANSACITETARLEVRGSSLAPLVKAGDTITAFYGFYECNPLERDDLVLYNHSGNDVPLLKIAKALPGDTFALEEAGGRWHILVNGEVLKNSEGQPHTLNQSGYDMLSLYAADYNGVIPKEAYLLLGNRSSGSLDSTVFGLVGTSDILGKVE